MSEEILKTVSYKDRSYDVIYDSRGRVRFTFTGKKDEMRYFDSPSAVQEYIDRFIQTENKLKSGALDIEREVIDAAGNTLTIRGINRVDGSAKVKNYYPLGERRGLRGGEEKTFAGNVYPNRSWIRDLLAKRRELKEQLNEVDKSLAPMEYNVYRARYHGKVSIDAYPTLMERLVTGLDTIESNANRTEEAMRKDGEKVA